MSSEEANTVVENNESNVSAHDHDHNKCCANDSHTVVADGTDGTDGANKSAKESEVRTGSHLTDITKAVQALALQESQTAGSAPRTIQDAQRRKYKFWDTQPVPKISEEVTSNEPIELDKPTEEIRKQPYSLPAGFEWDEVDLNNDEQLKELYTLLNENYVEDEDNMFRFDYSPEFLRWALQPPGWLPQWHCGVRVAKNKKLVCFISAIPANLKIYEKAKRLVEINFLCVHKKLRSKRVAPVLIREITRRVHEQGLFQAVYTGGVVLPKPVSTCRYWHRSLNPKKLVECRFSQLSKNMTMARTIKLYRLPDNPQTPGFRELRREDVPQAHKLMQEYLSTFDLSACFTEDDFVHWFMPRDGIINTYVVENDGEVTDVCSFYTLPSSVINHEVYKSLKAAYSFYNVAKKTPWPVLMKDALIAAKNMDFDVFNALDLMENKKFLGELKFGIGDGNLHYYLYNWRCPDMEPHRVGLVLQ